MNDAAPCSLREGEPTIALALGAGGARGLAHIAALEALDELGLKPAIIAGSSMGAARRQGAPSAAAVAREPVLLHPAKRRLRALGHAQE